MGLLLDHEKLRFIISFLDGRRNNKGVRLQQSMYIWGMHPSLFTYLRPSVRLSFLSVGEGATPPRCLTAQYSALISACSTRDLRVYDLPPSASLSPSHNSACKRALQSATSREKGGRHFSFRLREARAFCSPTDRRSNHMIADPSHGFSPKILL